MPDPKHEAVVATIQRINRLWLNGQVEDLGPMVHPEVVMVFPGFTGRIQGRQKFLAGFRDFCENAKVHEFRNYDHQSDLAGNFSFNERSRCHQIEHRLSVTSKLSSVTRSWEAIRFLAGVRYGQVPAPALLHESQEAL